MLDVVLQSGLCKTLIALIFTISVIFLYIIFKNGAEEDIESRTYYGIDKYILPYLAVVALPHVYFAIMMYCSGFIFLYIFNLAGLFLLWYAGIRGVIGGADAICFILVGITLPFCFPLPVMILSTLLIERCMRKKWNDSEKVPLLVPGKYGYVVTVPVTLILAIMIILGA